MKRNQPEVGTSVILQDSGRVGHLSLREVWRAASRIWLQLCLCALTSVTFVQPALGQAAEETGNSTQASSGSSQHWWQLFAAGFASSILAHEGAHIVAAYVVGGQPTFGLNEGRPTIYSGIDATLEPQKQFVFSSAGLTTQSVIDEAILDSPHHSSRAGAFERGILAGGIATSFFYVTIGRTGSVSDVDFMARTSNLSKTSITAIYGGLALLQSWRISRSSRYAHFFARPDPQRGGLRLGMTLEQ